MEVLKLVQQKAEEQLFLLQCLQAGRKGFKGEAVELKLNLRKGEAVRR